jgi:acyl-coenzyme A thioesterase PaaI-like protein
MANKFRTIVNKVNKAPRGMRSFLLTKIFCTTVKFAGTSSIKLVSVSNTEAVLTLENKKKVRNHIGGIHAIAAALLAESATGIVFGMNVLDSCVPLLKSMTIHYQRRMKGNLTAIAKISEADVQMIENSDKGSMMVGVEITDETEQQPIFCEMEWAWVKKRT